MEKSDTQTDRQIYSFSFCMELREKNILVGQISISTPSGHSPRQKRKEHKKDSKNE